MLHEVGYAILATLLVARAGVDNHGAVRNTTTHLTVNTPYAIRECICLKLFHSDALVKIGQCSSLRTP